MNRTFLGRALLLPLLCLGGIAAVLWLSGAYMRIPIADHRYHGFKPATGSLPASPHWAVQGATVSVPDSGWRPLIVSVVMQTAGPDVPVVLSINNDLVSRITATHERQSIRLTYTDRGGGPMWLRISPEPQDAAVGILDVGVAPQVERPRLWGMIAMGALLGACVWILIVCPRSLPAAGAATLLLVAAAMFGAKVFGAAALSSGAAAATAVWAGEAGRVVLLLFLLLFPGWLALDTATEILPPLLRENIPLLMLPATTLILSVLAVVLEVANVPNGAFFITCWLLYGLLTVLVLSDPGRRTRLWHLARSERALLLLPLLVSVCAILYAAVGVPSLDAIDDWPRIANRNVLPMPGDNVLSWLSSQTWRFHLPANALYFYPWRIGDRGPLYALLHVFLSRGIELQSPTFANYTRLGIVLNALFVMPLFVWLSSLMSRRTAWWCTALVALNPWFFLNIYFTWPKLPSAYFALAATWLLWRRPAPESAFVYATAGVLFGLAVLSHAGAALSLPVFLAISIAVFARSGRARLGLLLLVTAFVVVMLPWQLYKQWYSPESYSIFYMSYLGAKGYFTPLGENLARFAAEHPWREQLAVRWINVKELWWTSLRWNLISDFWAGRKTGLPLYLSEFFSPWFTAGVLWFVSIAAALPIALSLRRLARSRPVSATIVRWFAGVPSPPVSPRIWPAALLVALSLTLNEALRWERPFSHALPYLELVIFAGLLLVGLGRLGLAWLAVPALVILFRHEYYFVESATASVDDLPAMDMAGRLYWITLATILLLTCWSRLFAEEPARAEAKP